jgi:predicted metal-binding protein
MSPPVRPVLHVCVTCRAGEPEGAAPERPGARLHAALTDLNRAAGEPVDLRPVSCLAACERGCTAAISMPGKFAYLLGGMGPGTAEDVFDYAGRYAASPTGLVLPSRRAQSLRHAILGRFPHAEVGVADGGG